MNSTVETQSDLTKLRIRVAELWGATWGHPVFGHDMLWHVHLGRPPFEFDSSWAGVPPPFEECEKEIDTPDFPLDLNACHAFEERIWGLPCWNVYVRQLQDQRGDEGIHSTAEQRCRAFVAVMEGRSV